MNLKNYFKITIFATIMALIYTHMQMRIVELAYKGKDKEKEIHELADTNGVLTHQILTLKSANNLGNQLLEKDSNLQFMGNDRVMKYRMPATALRGSVQAPKQRVENPAWNLLSFLGAREARAWEQ